jgi:hypothetical protein
MRTLPWILVWAATLFGAWYLGRETAPGSPHGSEPEDGGSGAPGAEGGDGRAALDARKHADRFAEPPLGSARVGAPLDLSGATTGDEMRARLFAYAAAHLTEGREAHLALYRTLDRLFTDGTLARLLADEQEGPRTVYPLARFLVKRAEGVAALAESVFRTAAEQPAAFEGTAAATFELFADEVGPILAGALGDPRLQRLRGHVQAILDQPADRQPQPLRANRTALQRLIGRWAPVENPADALARLESGQAKGREAVALLRRVRPEDRARLDLVKLLGPVLDEGDVAAFTSDLAAGFDAHTLAALDARLVDASARLGTLSDWHLRRWLELTGRPGFESARGLLELAMRQGGPTADAAALALLGLAPRPTPAQADGLLRSYNVSPRVASSVRLAFGIK